MIWVDRLWCREKRAIEHVFDYYGGMSTGHLAEAERLLADAVAALRIAAGREVADRDLIEVLRVGAAVERELQRVGVDAVAELQRRGVFAEHGQRPHTALSDLLGIEHREAQWIVTAAEQACARTDLHGQVLPARLPATAAAFAAGTAGLRHVEVIAGLMASETAGRLPPPKWAEAEAQIAALAADYTPTALRSWGQELLSLLDQDGAEPDEREPAETNEVFLTRDRRGNGGYLKGRFTDAAMFDVIASLIDAKAAPLTADDARPLGQRQAEAMADIFGWVADHGDTAVAPASGGRRPHLNVLIRLEDLENRARAAVLDFGGTMTPGALRWLCCDACAIAVMGTVWRGPLEQGTRRSAGRECSAPGSRTSSMPSFHGGEYIGNRG